MFLTKWLFNFNDTTPKTGPFCATLSCFYISPFAPVYCNLLINSIWLKSCLVDDHAWLPPIVQKWYLIVMGLNISESRNVIFSLGWKLSGKNSILKSCSLWIHFRYAVLYLKGLATLKVLAQLTVLRKGHLSYPEILHQFYSEVMVWLL